MNKSVNSYHRGEVEIILSKSNCLITIQLKIRTSVRNSGYAMSTTDFCDGHVIYFFIRFNV